MLPTDDSVALTRALVRIDTSEGYEDGCTVPLAETLDGVGFEIAVVESAPGRSNLVANWRGGGPLVLVGHVDTVPFVTHRWAHSPIGAELVGDRLYGRGASDMKGGLAAMVVAACQAARQSAPSFTLLVTIGEEVGCLGVEDVLAQDLLDRARIFVIGESTDNSLRFGHKGATWIRLGSRGRSAHGSRPDLGVNAVLKLGSVLIDLVESFHLPAHAYLAAPTINVGTFFGGIQANLVPDEATAELDFRTVPGVNASDLVGLVQEHGPDLRVETVLDLPSVWTDPQSPVSLQMAHIVESVAGSSSTRELGLPYFTDGSVLAQIPGSLVYICGPGDPSEPHSVDESCSVARIREAQVIYRRLIDDAPELEELLEQGQDGVHV